MVSDEPKIKAELRYVDNAFHIKDAALLALIKSIPTDDEVAYKISLYSLLSEYYVTCGVTKEKIPLNDLCYWDVDAQIPLKNAEAALKYVKDKK